MYGKIILFLLPIFFLGFIIPVNAIQFDQATFNLNDNGNYVPFKVTQNSTGIYYQSKEGSYFFDGNSCSLTKYPGGFINNNPQFTDSYQVMASNTNNGTTNWNPVGIINNAQCNEFVTQHGNTISFGGVKTVNGAGSFNVTYTKILGQDLKITFSATNSNPVWTNYHIGLRETLSHVSQFITLGDNTIIDLSQNNNTGLSRTYIDTHKAQMLKIINGNFFNMGLGYAHLNSVTDFYKIGNPSLILDYIYNTPILSPGNTITIDPSITKDSAAVIQNHGAGSTASGSFTVTNNAHKILVADVSLYTAAGVGTISSVTWDGVSMTLVPGTAVATTTERHAFYYLLDSSLTGHTGTKTLTATFSGSQDDSSVAAWSLYNVDQVTGIQNGNKTSGSSGARYVDVTGSKTTSWILQGLDTPGGGSTLFSDTQDWLDGTALAMNGQHRSPAVIGKNYLSTGVAGSDFVTSGAEVLSYGFLPSAPTITKFNTINSTAINATWTNSTGAHWFFFNVTLSGGATTHINTTSLFKLLNNYTSGSRYTASVQAGNGTGASTASITKYNYTYNVAPTSPTISSITPSQARLGWTNPVSGNLTGGFNVYKVTALGNNYTLIQTSNNTNHLDLTGLQGNREYTAKIASRYAVGTNYTGQSANSTIVSFYTLPSSPTSLTATQSVPLRVLLSWTRPNDNGTVSGYFVERSLNNVVWSTLSANTGNSTTHYTDIVSSAGKYYYRVSAIQYAGTSSPSNVASITIYDTFTFRAYHHDGTTPVYGEGIQANATSSNNRFPLVSGVTTINGIFGNNNFTAWNSLINFIVGKQYNYNATLNRSLNMTTNDYDIDCSSTGTGIDVEVWTNGTNGHRITSFTTPTCFANNTMKWSTTFTANGNDLNSYNTVVYVRAVNATFATVAPLKYNNTMVTTVFTNPYIVSNSVTVGTGLQTKLFNWSMNLTVSPAFTPVNFTVGHISVSGINPVTAPIKFTSRIVNSSATAVTVTFPSTYTMGYQLTFGNEGKSQILTGLPVTSPSLGLGQSTITFKNPSNDFVTIKAYDLVSNTTASTILAQPNTNVPFVTQFKNFKNGLFGTSAMIGGINIIDLIVLIVAMIGLNRANEIVGAFMMVIIVGVAGFFQIITWPTAMVSAIALAVLITVVTMKKYQNS